MSEEVKSEQRTIQQNRAIHKWCEQIAEAYNELGLTVEKVIDNFTIELYWSKESVKELIIKTIIKDVYGKESTTQLLRGGQEIDKLIDMVTKFNSKVGIGYIPFPSEENVEEIVKN